MTEAIDRQKNKIKVTTIEKPVSDVLFHLRCVLIPAAEQIQYSEVARQDEFERLIQAQKT